MHDSRRLLPLAGLDVFFSACHLIIGKAVTTYLKKYTHIIAVIMTTNESRVSESPRYGGVDNSRQVCKAYYYSLIVDFLIAKKSTSTSRIYHI